MGYLFGFNPDNCSQCLFCIERNIAGSLKYYCNAYGQSESYKDREQDNIREVFMRNMTSEVVMFQKWDHCPLPSSKIERILKRK